MQCWWHKVRRVWIAVSAGIRRRKTRAERHAGCLGAAGLLNLRDDVRSCGYGDVQVMWNMLSLSSELEKSGRVPVAHGRRRSRSYSKQRSSSSSWRVLIWSRCPGRRRAAASSLREIKSRWRRAS
ncbi:uncharacterized protein LOC131165348 [Malania oleifera]|uniref:uncharacterized protein LOC131165348 n=1 Tax=Malania oleifera TaxID=397392 RepID=UPI0025AE827B|nr:uncharacterized protein LOC131165348 [Malania oleifera]